MKLLLVLVLVLMTGVNAGLLQSYRQGGNFAYAFNTRHHQPIDFVFPNGIVDYSYPTYSNYMYPELSVDDDFFRMGEELSGKWFLSNPKNTAHATTSTSGFPVITASASAVSTSGGVSTAGSAPNAIFQYPFLRLFHRVFNRPFSLSTRPNRHQAYTTSGFPIFSDADTVVINAIY